MQQTRFDLVVTDYKMPRMDGRELISHIREQSTQKEVPIIMVTTEFDPKKLAAVYQLGVSAISNKSFDREMVRNIVIQLFAGGET
jgi:two-component system chemotaxis response regulator CheY